MPLDAVAEIKARLDIVDVVGGYVSLQRSGREYKGLCPFHAEKTASFTVSQERQVWYCFGCQEGGDLISFVEKIERSDFRQVLEMLAERAGVELEDSSRAGSRGAARRRKIARDLNTRAQAYFQHVLWSTPAGASGRALLEQRGVDLATAQRFGIGFAPSGGASGDALVRYLTSRSGAEVGDIVAAGLAQTSGGQPRDRFRNRLVFPIRDEHGVTIGFGGRAMGDAIPKYLNTPDTVLYHKSAVLFGLDLARKAIEAEKAVVVVEGYFDVVAAHLGGVQHVVASSGTALTREQVRILARHAPTIILCFDGDDAGTAAASRAVDVIAGEGLSARICVLPQGVKDPDELVRRDSEAFAALLAAAAPEWQVLLDQAIGDAEGGGVEAHRAAAERCLLTLARIPEASTRELYLQQVARRLGIGTAALSADLDRVRRDGARRTRVTVSAPISVPLPDQAGADEDDARPMPEWELYLGSMVVHQPRLARAVIEDLQLDPEEIVHPAIRRVLRVALEAEDGAFPLHRLSQLDQRRGARLLMRDVPELAPEADPALLQRALQDCVRRVRTESVLRSLAKVDQELHRAREDGRDADVALLAGRVTELAAEAHRLRQPRG